jgi:hypothetical protein
LASGIVQGVEESAGGGPRSVSLDEIPVCENHEHSAQLVISGKQVYFQLPNFEAKLRLEAAIKAKAVATDASGDESELTD